MRRWELQGLPKGQLQQLGQRIPIILRIYVGVVNHPEQAGPSLFGVVRFAPLFPEDEGVFHFEVSVSHSVER